MGGETTRQVGNLHFMGWQEAEIAFMSTLVECTFLDKWLIFLFSFSVLRVN